jgi:phage baseplate assembly protein W
MIPHFAIPFRFHGQPLGGELGAVVTDQDSETEIMDCIETILRYPQGHIAEKPEFGTPDMTFNEFPPDELRIQAVLNVWEPRLEMEVGTPMLDRLDKLVTRILVDKAKARTETITNQSEIEA